MGAAAQKRDLVELTTARLRITSLIVLTLALIAVAAMAPRIPQDPAYHHFADTRTLLGVPNALNVLSNLPFLLVGVLGWHVVAKARSLQAAERWSYALCFAGVTLTAFGSAWYHWSPNNDTLVWDRLPMTLGFMGLLAGTICERVSQRAGAMLLVPLVAVGIATVVYWRMTEATGAGDLRPYALVQFGPAVLIPALLLLFPARYTLAIRYWRVFGWYAAAKFLEAADRRVFSAGGVVSGHTLKHLASAWACYEIAQILRLREPL
jgi:hypothetical protein